MMDRPAVVSSDILIKFLCLCENFVGGSWQCFILSGRFSFSNTGLLCLFNSLIECIVDALRPPAPITKNSSLFNYLPRTGLPKTEMTTTKSARGNCLLCQDCRLTDVACEISVTTVR